MNRQKERCNGNLLASTSGTGESSSHRLSLMSLRSVPPLVLPSPLIRFPARYATRREGNRMERDERDKEGEPSTRRPREGNR